MKSKNIKVSEPLIEYIQRICDRFGNIESYIIYMLLIDHIPSDIIKIIQSYI